MDNGNHKVFENQKFDGTHFTFFIRKWVKLISLFQKLQSLIPLEYLTSGIESNSTLLHIYLKLLHSGQITKDRNEFLFNVITTNIQNALNSASVGNSDGQMDQLKENFLQLKV